MSTAQTDNNFQSIRASCDRCRFQKLKCIVQDESGTCQRCLGAKVRCVFSPRARTGRPPEHKSGISKAATRSKKASRSSVDSLSIDTLVGREDSGVDSEPVSAKSTTVAMTTTSIDDENGIPTPVTHGSVSGAFGLADADALTTPTDIDFASLYEFDAMVNLAQGLPNGGVSPSDITVPLEDTGTWSDQPLLGMATDLRWINIATSTDESGRRGSIHVLDGVEGDLGVCMRRLSALAADMTESLKRLKNGPWTTSKPERMLEDYPIGDVLHLAQELVSILSVYKKSRGQAEDLVAASRNDHSGWEAERHSDPMQIAVAMDTPTTLLALSCYVLLTRLYSIVFGHIQNYLLALPSNNLRGYGLQSFRGLRLGELSPSNETSMLVYTAVNMLLNALGRIEDVLGLPADMRCVQDCEETGGPYFHTDKRGGMTLLAANLAMTMSRQEGMVGAGSIDVGSSGLPSSIREVKQALRVRLGL